MEGMEGALQYLKILLVLCPPAGSETSELEEGLPFSIKPLAKELYETLINERTHPSPGDHFGAAAGWRRRKSGPVLA